MRRPRRRTAEPDEVAFPVTPMLDMAFQLLAFFVLTYQEPSRETRLDLDLPSASAALPPDPRATSGRASAIDDLENDLIVRALADDRGGLASLRLGEAPLPSPEALTERLTRYSGLLEGRPLRVSIAADDRLRYEHAAALIGACSAAGVDAIRLTGPPR